MDEKSKKFPVSLTNLPRPGTLYRLINNSDYDEIGVHNGDIIILLHVQRADVWLMITCLCNGLIHKFNILWDAWDEYLERIA